MKGIDLGQAISAVANIGVIVGIVFLVVELRQNNEVLALQVQSEDRARVSGIIELVVANPEYADLMVKDASALTESERNRLMFLGIRMIVNFEELYTDFVSGRITEDEATRRVVSIWERDADYGVRLAWPVTKSRYSPEFIAWIETIMDRQPAAVPVGER
jgi:hypothetical protein